jgi:hypothetical protein
MLNFGKLIPQLETLGADVMTEQTDRSEAAKEVLIDAQASGDAFRKKLYQSEQLTFWPLAMPIEDFSGTWKISQPSYPYTVVAVDGSQIMPSQHEVYSCYLINVGQCVISYGAEAPVILDSTPILFHSLEDIYPLIDRRRLHVDESYITFERTLNELSSLRDLSLQAQDRALPVVAFVDGSLTIWSLDKMSDTYQKYYIERLVTVLDSFKRNRIPLIGYISHSRSSDLVNALRVWKCPYALSNCESLCGHLKEDEFPCSEIWPSLDRNVLHERLEKHERCAIFAAGMSTGLPMPDEHRRCFLYLNVGKEVARLEFPRWLADDRELFNQALEIVLAQAEKGSGYPVCIAEAHNMAVVRAADRSKFFDILAQHLVESGVKRVRISPKETGKRRSIV